MKSLMMAGFALTAAMAFAAPASAVTFAGSSEGSFSGLVVTASPPGTPNGCITESSTRVSWGSPQACPDTTGNEKDSTMKWTVNSGTNDFDFSQGLSGGLNKVTIGQLTWTNEVNTINANNDISVDLSIDLDITQPGAVSASDVLTISIDNTNLNPADEALFIDFDNFFLALPYELAENVWLTGFIFEIGNGVGSFANNLWVNDEDSTSVLNLIALVRHDVPEPAALGILGLGLLGLGVARRRRA